MAEEKTKNKATSLHKKLLDVRKQILSLDKTEKNKFHGFSFVSSTNCLTTIRPILDEAGLLLVPRIIDRVLHFTRTDKDKREHLTEILTEYEWIDTDTGESLKCQWYGQGCDSGELGIGKALTYSEKHFLLKFFQIPTDEADPDAGNRYDKQPAQKTEPPKQPQQKQQTQPKQPPTPGKTEAEVCEILSQNQAVVDDYLRNGALPEFRIGPWDSWDVLKEDKEKWGKVLAHHDRLLDAAMEFYNTKLKNGNVEY